MNIPSTKEETDLILFDLLEGNLSKKEEEFWYDYSLKNKDFAIQLELFRKIYMKDDIISYPDLSQMLRKSPWYMTLKWQLVLSASAVLVASTVFYFTTPKTYTKVIPINNKQDSVTKRIEEPKPVETRTITNKVIPQKTILKEIPHAHQNLKQTKPAETHQNKPQQIVSSLPIAVKDTVITIKEESTVEKIEEPVIEPKKEIIETKKQESIEAPKEKEKKSIPLKIKVKTSKKTKTTDFNY
jgi:hypothetical protein